MGKFGFKAVSLGLTALAFGFSAQAAELVGHTVDYQVVMTKLPPGATGDGSWQLGITPNCKGWSYSQIANINVKAGDRATSIAITQRGDEASDGLSANYVTQFSGNGQQVLIKAALSFPAKGAAGKMNVTVGADDATRDIPAGTLMLAAASQAMVDQLAAGKTDFTISTIESTAPNGIAQLHIQVLANSPFGATPLPAASQDMLKGKSWFIKLTKQQANGAVDTMMQVYDNGIVTRMIIDMSGIGMELIASKVAIVPKPAC